MSDNWKELKEEKQELLRDSHYDEYNMGWKADPLVLV